MMEYIRIKIRKSYRLTKKGKANIEFIVMTMVALATIGYIMGGSWLLWAITTSGVAM